VQAAEEEGMQAPREGTERCSNGYIAEPNDTGWWTSSVKSPDFPRKLVSNWGPTNRHTAEMVPEYTTQSGDTLPLLVGAEAPGRQINDCVMVHIDACPSDGGTFGAFSMESKCGVGHNGSGGAGGDVLIACTPPPGVLEMPSRVSVPPRQANFPKINRAAIGTPSRSSDEVVEGEVDPDAKTQYAKTKPGRKCVPSNCSYV
jgi:hypothetical protein